MFNAKVAVPLLAGVPVMVQVKLPELAKTPADKMAVKPVTPVEVTGCQSCVPLFPPE